MFNSNVSGPVCAGQFKAGYIPSGITNAFFWQHTYAYTCTYSYTDFNDGDKPDSQYWFLFIAAVIIVALGLTRLIMEMIQFILRRLNYIKDWINWMENLIFAFSIVFVWVFHTDCYCQYSWQWQIGVMAVFLAWINMIIFISKLPLTGIYVVMFLDIFYTFMRMVLLSLLLVLSFSFAFYMLFYKPDLQVSYVACTVISHSHTDNTAASIIASDYASTLPLIVPGPYTICISGSNHHQNNDHDNWGI